MRPRPKPNPGGRGNKGSITAAWPLLVPALIIFGLAFTRRLPGDLSTEEISRARVQSRELVEPECQCSPQQQQAPPSPAAPTYCRLGLPDNSGSSGASSSDASSAGQGSSGSGGSGDGERKHKLAVLIPYRDREQHVSTLLSRLHPYLTRQGLEFDSFVIEQGDSYLFNRGALLNAGALLLQGSAYDYFVFQDADTIPKDEGGIRYDYPRGIAPLHLTPYGIHPKATYQDFFGGIVVFTREQLQRVNGFGTQFWGWGREDDNMRERLLRTGMWPPQLPDLSSQQQGQPPLKGGVATDRGHYFVHQQHKQASELRGQEVNGSLVFFEEHPNKPYRGAKIMSSQPDLLLDMSTGLNTTQFRVTAVRPFAEAVKITVEIYCNTTATPWCMPTAISQRRPDERAKRGQQVHAVASGIT